MIIFIVVSLALILIGAMLFCKLLFTDFLTASDPLTTAVIKTVILHIYWIAATIILIIIGGVYGKV